jgi:hypothetical protein
MLIDNDKKTRIAILVTFGDYKEILKQSFSGFSYLPDNCKN